MSLAFTLLLVTVAASPVLAIFDGSAVTSVVGVLEVIALAVVGISARAPDIIFASRVTRYLKLAVVVPAVWMIIQLLPLPFGSHSIWINANEALNQQSWGHISIDLGATINALAFYLANLALVVVGMFVARDRRRAELTLFAVAAITILTTVMLLVSNLGHDVDREITSERLSAVSAVGLILSLSLAAQGMERYESKRSESTRSAREIQTAFVIAALGLVICVAGLAFDATVNSALTALFGVGVFASVQAIRRAGLPNWAAGITLATLIIAAAMVVAWRYDATRSISPLLQFATQAPADALSMAQRMLSDATWRGNGAGTYAQLAPIYQELGNLVASPPTGAAKIIIELGWPMGLLILVGAIALIVVLYRGALGRGRDSFYPAAAAACVVTILGEAFCNASLFNTSVAVISDAIIGLGLAQSVSSGDSY